MKSEPTSRPRIKLPGLVERGRALLHLALNFIQFLEENSDDLDKLFGINKEVKKGDIDTDIQRQADTNGVPVANTGRTG